MKLSSFRWRDQLVPLVDSSACAAYRKELRSRTALQDEAFYQHFYASRNITKDMPIRLRKLLATWIDELLWVHPEDEFARVNDELDLWEVLDRISKEFKVPFDSSDWKGHDSFSFDWLVQWIQKEARSHNTPLSIS